jgi:hypothetical protein
MQMTESGKEQNGDSGDRLPADLFLSGYLYPLDDEPIPILCCPQAWMAWSLVPSQFAAKISVKRYG